MPDNKPSPEEAKARQRQTEKVAEGTREAERKEWGTAITQASKEPPYRNMLAGPPPMTSPHYAVEGLKSVVGERMRAQGEAASGQGTKGSFEHGGTVPETGNYKLHKGETVLPRRKPSRIFIHPWKG